MGETLSPTGGRAVGVPDGAGAAGAAFVSMARVAVLLEQVNRSLVLFEEMGKEIADEVRVTGELAEFLTASLGEREALQQLRILADMLDKVSKSGQILVTKNREQVQAALVANAQVLRAQADLHALGADGAYVDGQRRAG